MTFRSAAREASVLRELLTAYYREGEDADTPQAELDDFVSFLQDLLESGTLMGDVAFEGTQALGFVLYAVDHVGFPFSERPGLGTIAEIGIIPEARGRRLGSALVHRAEELLQESVQEMYVCAYPAAQGFWQKCGYHPSGDTAGNGLPVFTKSFSKP